jgi:hypothetical protein
VPITGTILGNSTQSIAATITLMPAVTVSLTPGVVTLNGSQTQQFTATVSNTSNTAVTWTIDPPSAGSFSAPGLYTAPPSVTTPQTVTVTATSQADTSQSASATVMLAPTGWPTVQIGVTPLGAMLYGGQTQQFTASVTNTNNTAVNWTVSPTGTGSITSSGLYTAPTTISSEQTVTITASSQAEPSQSASASIVLSPTECTSSGYSYVRQIVINHTHVPNTDQTNFPFLVNVIDPLLATTAHNGHVTNSNGYDIVFSSDPNGLSILNFEIEEYVPASGQLVAWVNIPTLSHGSNTVLYMFYGNPSITTSQQNSTAVWDSNYQAVYHLANIASGTAKDSTSNGNSGTVSGVTAATGEIDGAASFNGTGADISTNYVQNSATAYTVEAWLNSTSTNADIVVDDRGTSGHSLTFGLDGDGGCGGSNCGQLGSLWNPPGVLMFGDDSDGVFIGAEGATALNDGQPGPQAQDLPFHQASSLCMSMEIQLRIPGRSAPAMMQLHYPALVEPSLEMALAIMRG